MKKKLGEWLEAFGVFLVSRPRWFQSFMITLVLAAVLALGGGALIVAVLLVALFGKLIAALFGGVVAMNVICLIIVFCIVWLAVHSKLEG